MSVPEVSARRPNKAQIFVRYLLRPIRNGFSYCWRWRGGRVEKIGQDRRNHFCRFPTAAFGPQGVANDEPEPATVAIDPGAPRTAGAKAPEKGRLTGGAQGQAVRAILPAAGASSSCGVKTCVTGGDHACGYFSTGFPAFSQALMPPSR